jgi:CDP-diacylglycerol--glycerol-3-phosphate 3-phosphatidyltransferase
LFALGYTKTAGAVMLFAGLFDALDGAVARESNLMSSFGAFLDSTLDRLSESAIFVGIVFFYASVLEPLRGPTGRRSNDLLTHDFLYPRPRRGTGVRVRGRPPRTRGPGRILSLFSLTGFLIAASASSPSAPS